MTDARQNHHTRDLGVLSLGVIAPVWGYSWVVSKVALGYARPFTFVALITAFGAACLFAVLLATRRSLSPPPLAWVVPIGLLQTALFNCLAIVALDAGGAGKVSVLAYTMPFWLLILAWLFLGERLHGLQWPAVAVAFAGLVLVVRPWDSAGLLSGALACASGLAWAGGALLVKLLQRRTHVDVLSLTAWQMAFGAGALAVIAVATQSGRPEWTAAFILCLAYSALLANALCWGLWVLALRSLRAGAAGMGTLAVPVVGAAASWLQLGERPAAAEATGMALIIAALAMLAAGGLRAGRRGAAVAVEEQSIPPVID